MPKKKNSYWKERQLIIQENVLKYGDDLNEEIAKKYERAIRDIENDIHVFYSKFSDNNTISYADAKKILDSDDIKNFKMDLYEYIEKAKTLNYSDTYKKELEDASIAHRIERLKMLKIQMKDKIETLKSYTEEKLEDTLKKTYSDAYYKNIINMKDMLKVGVKFDKSNDKKLDLIIKKPSNGEKTFSDRIWNDKKKLINKLETDVTNAFIRGDSKDKVIRDIKSTFQVSKHNAKQIVLTESAFFSSRASLDSYIEMGVEEYEILATLDGKTSEICREEDGRVYKVKKADIGINFPPFHPLCRTTTVPYFDDDIYGEGIARDEDIDLKEDLKNISKSGKIETSESGEVGTTDMPTGDDNTKGSADALGNAKFRDVKQSDIDLLDEITNKYKQSPKKNVAASKGIIDGDEINLESISGKIDPNNPSHKGNFSKPQENYYKSRHPEVKRVNDSEQKIIESIRETYKGKPDVSGEIDIISKNKICESCNDIISQFSDDFPNIKINLVQLRNK